MFKYLLPLLFLSLACNSQNLDFTSEDSLDIQRIDTLRNYVRSEFFKRNYDKAIEYGELARKLSKKHNYFDEYYKFSSFLGSSYLEIDDSIRAKFIFNEGVEISKKENDTIGLIVAEIDFANFYALRDDNASKITAIKLYEGILPLAKIIGSKD